mmetsp:Transcript_17823/g.50522  ORF Transcript_17823/g.50522 Transcript_17823/m.50522 type:complete len:228 (-) Transcript_17823:203-886(-)
MWCNAMYRISQTQRLNLLLGEEVGVLLVRVGEDGVVLPQLRREVPVGGAEGVEEGLDGVAHGARVAAGAGVAIVDAGHVHELLAGRGGDEPRSARGRDETDADGSALSGDLARHGVRHPGHASPVPSSHGGDVELGGGDGAADGGGHFGGALDPEADVAGAVAHGHEGLEAGALAGGRLLLHGHDLHDLVLQLVLEEEVDDLGLLHRNGEEEDLLDARDLALLHEAA